MKTVVGAFSDASEARKTFDELMRAGVKQGNISVIASADSKARMGNIDLRPIEAADAGKLQACGPIADTMRSRPELRGISSSLRYMGLSHEQAAHYAEAVRAGETLEGALVSDEDASRVAEIMSHHAARWGETMESFREIEQPKAQAAKAPQKSPEPKTDDVYIPVLREELRVGTRAVESGDVHVTVRVADVPVDANVRLREEHVEIERRPADRAPRPDEGIFKDAVFELKERGEEPVVMKEVKVVEEIRLRKNVTEHEETITDRVRATEIDIAKRPGAAHDGASTMPTSTPEARPERYAKHELDRGIPVLREELHVGKREVDRGSTIVGVRTSERPATEKVRLHDEHVAVERRPTNRRATAADGTFKNEELDIVEYSEEPVVSKELKVVEEIRFKRGVDEHDETIHDKVRSTTVTVSQRDERGLYRKHFESLGLGAGAKFDDHLPAYEYGQSLRTAGASNEWDDIEPHAKARWEAQNPGTWQRVKESIRYAFSKRS